MSADAGAAASAANQPEAMGAEPAARRARAMPAQARAEDRADAFADSSARATSAAAAAAPEAGSSSAHARSARAEARGRLRAETFVARRAAAAPAAAADVERRLLTFHGRNVLVPQEVQKAVPTARADSSATTTPPAAPQGGNESACPRALSSAPAVGDVRILPRIVRFFACSAQILMSGDRGPPCRVAAAVVAVCRACIPDANADNGTAIRVSDPMRSNSARSSSTLPCRD